jgi:TolA-binding protein
MRYLTGFFLIVIIAFTSCKPADSPEVQKAKQDSVTKMAARSKYLKAITDAEAEMRKTKNYDQKLAMAALKAYNDFTVTFPDDSLTAEYLFLASDLAQGSRNYQQAAVYLETIIDKHKDFKKYSDAIFVAAFIYDSYLEDVNHGGDRAKQLYQFEIDHYPNSPYAAQSKVLIQYIGKPDSVLINDIINKGQQQEKKKKK